MSDFKSEEGMQAWLLANGGVEGLRLQLDTGRIANQNKMHAEAWLKAYDRKQMMTDSQTQLGLLERQVLAAETSATAAHTSARWAKWAAVVAVVAAIVSVAQSINQR